MVDYFRVALSFCGNRIYDPKWNARYFAEKVPGLDGDSCVGICVSVEVNRFLLETDEVPMEFR